MNNGAFNWAFMPEELRPNWKRKHSSKNNANKVKKVVNIEETLKALEQKELSGKGNEDGPNKDTNKESDNVSGSMELLCRIANWFQIKKKISFSFLFDSVLKEEVEDEQQDDEMDEDNDYGMNYFDNGENYNDEDDNLDDGPTY